MDELCKKPMSGRSKFEAHFERKCARLAGHEGKCHEYPYLKQLAKVAPRVANKIKRDSTKTTGAAWKSDDAGPNRIDRWAMLLPDKLLSDEFGIHMDQLKPSVYAKLRDKAASYDDCMEVAKALTILAYNMPDVPEPDKQTKGYFQTIGLPLGEFKTTCIICKDVLNFDLFEGAQRGKANIETAHANPRLHEADNVGFAHRECNIAQGDKSLDEFYDWMSQILDRTKNKT